MKSKYKLSTIKDTTQLQIFEGAYDNEGVYVYQAYCNTIADFALEHQRFGGDDFNPNRMVRQNAVSLFYFCKSIQGNFYLVRQTLQINFKKCF